MPGDRYICEAGIDVKGPADQVWRVLAEVEARPTWTPTMSRVRGREGPALRLGASFTIRQPRLLPATWVVTALDPRGHFQWTSRAPGLRVKADHVVQAKDPASCQVRLRVGFSGLLAPLAGPLARSLTESYLEQECASLKAVVEARRH